MGTKPSSLLRVPVEMPNRSGHNLSHSNSLTGTTGTLIPVLCEELLPNDTISLGDQLQVQLPPMVTDFYGRVDYVLEAFFVPNRLCWGGWEDFITHPTNNPQYPEGTAVQAKPTKVPYFYHPSSEYIIEKDSLLHYLDYGKAIAASGLASGSPDPSLLPAIAYHRIWDDWYRDSRVQAPLFYRPASSPVSASQLNADTSINLRSLPYFSSLSLGGSSSALVVKATDTFSDGVSISSLRQRNWVKDYFTSASPSPQAGGASAVNFEVAEGEGSFTISTLRSANSLQKWLERNNLAGYRYGDQIYAQFGIYPADAIMDRPLYLGRNIQTVYNRTVFSTVDASSDTGGVLGTKGANSQVLGEGSLIKKFTASEHGFIMVLASLVPRPVYGSGLERRNYRQTVGDFAFPLLAGMGDQEIKNYELTGYIAHNFTFGYTDLYAEYKFRNDKVHGLMADGQVLDSYALQRSFDSTQDSISSDFLLIPTDYLDQVQAVKTAVQGYTYWSEIFFILKKISTIPAYSQPTLADLQNAHTEYISRGGKRL